MKATCWMGVHRIEVRDVPDPKILNSRDAIVRITATAICGSDLHLLDGYVPTMEKGDSATCVRSWRRWSSPRRSRTGPARWTGVRN